MFCATVLLTLPCFPDDPKPSDPGQGQDLNSMTLDQLMQVKVESAALHPQTLEDAPASVTVITAEDIRKYGYRTLGEALSSVRGFYVTNDRTYESIGVRGFSFPGDYSSHLLVMVNGHNMADNVFNYMLYFENEFPIEMNLVKQIEIVRGPASALYGSNAMFATVNIITKSPDEVGPLALTADTGSFGERKGQIVAAGSLAGAKMLFSGSVFNNAGESPLYFPQYDTPQSNNGKAVDMAGEKGYHFFATLDWRHWTVTAAFSGDSKTQPISWGSTIFNDRGTRNNDERNFIHAAYQREIGGGTLRWRTYYDAFHYEGRGDYALGGGAVEDNRQSEIGAWVGTQLTYRIRPFFAGDITVGIESDIDIKALLTDYDVSPAPVTYLSTSHRDRSLDLIFEDEKKVSEQWKVDLGFRVDTSSIHPDFFSPRAALIYQPSQWTYKLLYGRSFRNPSAFQLFYGDGIADAANPNLRPESADTLEVDAERKLGKRINLQTSAYGYRLHNFLLGVYLPDGLLQYQNGNGIIRAEGVELELNGRPTNWLEAAASYAMQRSTDHTGRLDNSAQHLAKLRFAVPLSRKFDLSSGMRYTSSRLTLTGNSLKPIYLADFTLISKHFLRNFDFRLGLRNTFNLKYADPIALSPIVDSMPEPGRSFFVELIAHRASSTARD
jgi:outer membrane receptor protein involved in Fe transport